MCACKWAGNIFCILCSQHTLSDSSLHFDFQTLRKDIVKAKVCFISDSSLVLPAFSLFSVRVKSD